MVLEKRVYSRQELLELFKTNRLDNIKRDIKKAGYDFVSCGRGANYTMEIVQLPNDDLKSYCVRELKFAPQTDFNMLKYFLFCFVNDKDDEFINLQFNEMPEKMAAYGISMDEKTAASYYHHLEQTGWFDRVMEYKYFIRYEGKRNYKEISKDEYKKIWQAVHEKAESEGCQTYYGKNKICRSLYGGIAYKKMMKRANGIYVKDFNVIKELIEKEIKPNDERI